MPTSKGIGWVGAHCSIGLMARTCVCVCVCVYLSSSVCMLCFSQIEKKARLQRELGGATLLHWFG